MKMDENKYLNRISDVCKACAEDLFDLFDKHNLKAIHFNQHPDVDVPNITFDADDGASMYCGVESITLTEFEDSSKNILNLSGTDDNGCQWCAYIDWWGGDYFAVGQDIGKIYCAVVEVINSGKFSPNELK